MTILPIQLSALTHLSLPIVELAMSSSTIFNSGWSADHEGGLNGWRAYTQENEQVPMEPGPGFRLFRQLLALNQYAPDPMQPLVRIHIVSRQAPDVFMRFHNSLEHFGLLAQRGLGSMHFLNGGPVIPTLLSTGVRLFLSSNPTSVRKALAVSMAAAHLTAFTPSPTAINPTDPNPIEVSSAAHDEPLLIGFDCDAVVVSDEAEAVYHEKGLAAFEEHEAKNADVPLAPGPLFPFLRTLYDLRTLFPEPLSRSPLELVAITARGPIGQKRIARTLSEWNMRFDRMHFMAGMAKGPLLRAIGATILFDDGLRNIESAKEHGIPAAHVPWGIKNQA